MSDLALPPNEPSKGDNRPAILSPPSKAAQDYQNELLEEQGEEHPKVEPGVLADAISQLQSLRTSTAPSRATSPAASGASSPHAPGVPGIADRIALERQPSVPGTPHFGAQTDM
jgi:6-phosphofructo-2-kinase/fructose-2,6-biphosphatase 2